MIKNMTWYDIWYDMIDIYDMIWYDIIWYTWYDT